MSPPAAAVGADENWRATGANAAPCWIWVISCCAPLMASFMPPARAASMKISPTWKRGSLAAAFRRCSMVET